MATRKKSTGRATTRRTTARKPAGAAARPASKAGEQPRPRAATGGDARERGRTAASRRAQPSAGEGARSRTARTAKWIESPDQHADRPGQTLATRSHEVIRRWAEERGAQPATATWRNGRPATLRLDFPGYGGQNLQPVGWDEWFRVFDERKLTFLYQEALRNGRPSNFFRLESPERGEA